MSDVSSNEVIEDQESEDQESEDQESEDQESEDQESEDQESEDQESFNPDYNIHEDYVSEPQTLLMENSSDYSTYLTNIDTTLKFQTAVIIGFLLLVGFVVGWKK